MEREESPPFQPPITFHLTVCWRLRNGKEGGHRIASTPQRRRRRRSFKLSKPPSLLTQTTSHWRPSSIQCQWNAVCHPPPLKPQTTRSEPVDYTLTDFRKRPADILAIASSRDWSRRNAESKSKIYANSQSDVTATPISRGYAIVSRTQPTPAAVTVQESQDHQLHSYVLTG